MYTNKETMESTHPSIQLSYIIYPSILNQLYFKALYYNHYSDIHNIMCNVQPKHAQQFVCVIHYFNLLLIHMILMIATDPQHHVQSQSPHSEMIIHQPLRPKITEEHVNNSANKVISLAVRLETKMRGACQW